MELIISCAYDSYSESSSPDDGIPPSRSALGPFLGRPNHELLLFLISFLHLFLSFFSLFFCLSTISLSFAALSSFDLGAGGSSICSGSRSL